MVEGVLAWCGSGAAPEALLAQTGLAEGVIAFVLAIQVPYGTVPTYQKLGRHG